MNIQNAKTHLSRLVEEVVLGEEIVIARAGRPLVKLTPFEKQAQPRKLGVLAGQVSEAPGCWDADPELEALFYDEAPEGLARVAEDAP